jgi:hypothetical protein
MNDCCIVVFMIIIGDGILYSVKRNRMQNDAQSKSEEARKETSVMVTPSCHSLPLLNTRKGKGDGWLRDKEARKETSVMVTPSCHSLPLLNTRKGKGGGWLPDNFLYCNVHYLFLAPKFPAIISCFRLFFFLFFFFFL